VGRKYQRGIYDIGKVEIHQCQPAEIVELINQGGNVPASQNLERGR
jgi:hypothetical protein